MHCKIPLLIVKNVGLGFYLPGRTAQVECMYGKHWTGKFKKTDRKKKKRAVNTCNESSADIERFIDFTHVFSNRRE